MRAPESDGDETGAGEPHQSHTDAEYISGVRAGDQGLFNALVLAYFPRLVQFAVGTLHRQDAAEDIALIRPQDRVALAQALVELPERRRLAVQLCYVQQLSHAEIGEVPICVSLDILGDAIGEPLRALTTTSFKIGYSSWDIVG